MKRPRLLVAHFATLSRYSLRYLQLLSENFDTAFIFIDDPQSRALAAEAGLPARAFYKDHGFLAYRHAVSHHLFAEALRRDYDVSLGGGLFSFSFHACLAAARTTGRGYVLHCEDWWWPDGLDVSLARPFLARLPAMATARVAASTRCRDFLLENGAPAYGTFLGLDATEDLAERPLSKDVLAELAARHTASDRLTLLYLNRVVRYKGLDVLLRALGQCSDLTQEIALLVVGDGPFLDECRELAHQLSLDNVQFVGACEASKSHYYYRMADVFVHPCRFEQNTRVKAEAWGFTINEAMSMSLPIIATDAVAAAIDLVDESCGMVLPAGDVDALAGTIRWSVQNREALKAMGETARSRLLGKCTPELQCEAVSEAIRFAFARTKGNC